MVGEAALPDAVEEEAALLPLPTATELGFSTVDVLTPDALPLAGVVARVMAAGALESTVADCVVCEVARSAALTDWLVSRPSPGKLQPARMQTSTPEKQNRPIVNFPSHVRFIPDVSEFALQIRIWRTTEDNE